MKIFIICSKKFYDRVSPVKLELERAGHIVALPNCFDKPDTEEVFKNLGTKEHSAWKATMLKHSTDVISKNDAVLVLNFHKNAMKNYIGGATFLEMYDAFRSGKKIYLFNDIPEGILHDEIQGFEPIVIGKDLARIS